VGDAVVCPRRGIGVTVDRAVRDQQGARREYLTIRIERLRMTVMLPVARAARAGLRPPAGAHTFDQALPALTDAPSGAPAGWAARMKHNQAKLRCGDVRALVEVVRDLSRLAATRGLGIRERGQYASRARRTLDGLVAHAVEVAVA
jgi:CarD family transcriptional regulator